VPATKPAAPPIFTNPLGNTPVPKPAATAAAKPSTTR
jgi:hypothetical protein